MHLNELGNLYSSGNAFTTKAALLQSLYRVNHQMPIGETTVTMQDGVDEKGKPKKKKVRKEYGHIVDGGEAKNLNFYDEDIFDYAGKRVKNKIKEETIKSDRLFNNLLSSMPLTFNLFFPLMQLLKTDPQKASSLVASLFPSWKVATVERIEIEFIPLPITDYTNDKSAMDAVIFFTDKDGGQNIIAIEVKYTDSLGTNKATENDEKYYAAKDSGYFTTEGLIEIDKGCTQIFRNFLLTEKYRMKNNLSKSYNVILAPAEHPSTIAELNALKKYFNETCPTDKLIKYDLETFVAVLEENVPTEMKDWTIWLYNRYLDFNQVKDLLKKLK